MITFRKAFLLFALALAIFSCCKEDPALAYLKMLDHIPANTYNEQDVIANSGFPQMNGVWEVIGSSGGFTGAGYGADFDYLLIKPNAIFGIVRNDSLITTGQIEVLDDPNVDLVVRFVPEDQVNIIILQGLEQYVFFPSDSMLLNSPCCDFYDTQLRRVD